MSRVEIMNLEDNFSNALDLFNSQKWYEAHDAFEDIWNNLNGDERQIIQGILQVSVSQYHLSKGNLNGATILLGEGLGRIRNRTNTNLGIDLETFCKCLEKLLIKLQKRDELNEFDKPYLIRQIKNEF